MGDGRGLARRVDRRHRRPLLRATMLAGVAALVVGVGAAIAAITFNGAPGTGAPPATLGGYTMTPFSADPQPLFTNVSSVAAPTGTLGFSPSLNHRKVGNGWLTWSHGYTGDVYVTTGTTATLTLPANTVAFYLYVEPNIFGSANVTATSNGGITSGPVNVDGNSGAKYFGFYATGADTLTSITVDVPAPALGFAIGEFGIAYRQLANNPPDCSKVKADRTALWPPNHKFQTISLSGLTDPDGDPTTLTITGVTQDEPINGLGDGDASPDAATAGSASKVQIRAERSGKGDGRVYAINFTGADNRGGSCTGTVRVTVGHGAKGQPVDSGQKYNSFGP